MNGLVEQGAGVDPRQGLEEGDEAEVGEDREPETVNAVTLF